MAKQMPRPETQPTKEQESTLKSRGSDPSTGAILPVGYSVGLWLGLGECGFLMLNSIRTFFG